MAYTRTDWKDGTTPIDAANMNKIEDGIAANADDISSLNDDLTNIDIFNVGASINEGDDLDDYTTPGRYSCTASATAGTLSNTPVTNNLFILLVLRYNSSLRFVQIVLRCANASAAIFYRNMTTNNSWTGWYSLTGTGISTSSVGDPVVMGDDA